MSRRRGVLPGRAVRTGGTVRAGVAVLPRLTRLAVVGVAVGPGGLRARRTPGLVAAGIADGRRVRSRLRRGRLICRRHWRAGLLEICGGQLVGSGWSGHGVRRLWGLGHGANALTALGVCIGAMAALSGLAKVFVLLVRR